MCWWSAEHELCVCISSSSSRVPSVLCTGCCRCQWYSVFFFKEPLWKPLMELCRPLENRICSLRASLLRMRMHGLTYVALCCILISYSLVCWVCFTHDCWVPLICWAVFNLQAHLTHPFRFHPSVFLWNTWCLRKNPYWFGGFVCVFCFCFPAPDIKGIL